MTYLTIKPEDMQPTRFIINGFDLKDTILDVFRDYPQIIDMYEEQDNMADDIVEVLAQKMGIVQGEK